MNSRNLLICGLIVFIIIICGFSCCPCNMDQTYHNGNVITATKTEGPVKVEVREYQPGYVYKAVAGVDKGAIVDIRSNDSRGRITLANNGRVDDSLTFDHSQFSILYSGASEWSFTTKRENVNFNLADWYYQQGQGFVYIDDTPKTEGKVGVGAWDPTAKLDVFGAAGYDQFRMRTPFTPKYSKDPRGHVGDLAWDNNYIYLKTRAGWKRVRLETF